MIPKLNLLFSYYYMRTHKEWSNYILHLAQRSNVLIDSGAFTNRYQSIKALKQGKNFDPVTLEEYIEVCQRALDGQVWGYIMLDEIGDAEQTWRNYQVMLDEGLTPIPVFQHAEKWDRIDDYLSASSRISVGGIAGDVPGNKADYARHRIQRIDKEAKGKARIHALGFLRYPDIFQLPLTYADSSGWSAGHRWGKVTFYDIRSGFSGETWTDLTKNWHDPDVQRLVGHFKRMGMTKDQIVDRSYYRTMEGIPSMMTTFAYIRFHHHAHQLGFNFFFAVRNTHCMFNLLAVLKNMRDLHTFDYHQARADYRQMASAWLNSKGLVLERSDDVLTEKTDFRATLE